MAPVIRKWFLWLGVIVVFIALIGTFAVRSQFKTVIVSPPDGPPLAVPTNDAPGPFPHGAFDAVLSRFVDGEGRVDYRGLASNRAELERYMVALAQTSPSSAPEAFATREAQLAYWINAYNASVLYAVTERPGLTSVHSVRFTFFGFTRYVYGGESMSLHALENELIRPTFEEPRIHFALNCASAGCPKLPSEAFVPERLEAQLARETRAFCADPDKVRVSDGDVQMSQIFQWYAEDFVDAGGAIDFCRRWGRDDLPAGGKLRYIPYDWSLNAAPGRRLTTEAN